MKIKVIVCLFFLGFLVLSRSAYGQNFDVYNNLNDVLKVASENQIEVREWRVYYRSIEENVAPAELKQMISLIKRDNSFTWSEEGDEIHHKTITGVKSNNQEGTQITISLIKNGELFDVSQSYQITGNSVVSLNKVQSFNIPSQFKKCKPYIAVSGKKTDTDIDQLEIQLLNSLSASYVEGLKERNFISVSAFSKKFNHSIHTNTGKAFNVQIGLRKSDSKEIFVTVGTPIITTEY